MRLGQNSPAPVPAWVRAGKDSDTDGANSSTVDSRCDKAFSSSAKKSGPLAILSRGLRGGFGSSRVVPVPSTEAVSSAAQDVSGRSLERGLDPVPTVLQPSAAPEDNEDEKSRPDTNSDSDAGALPWGRAWSQCFASTNMDVWR